MKTDKSVIKSSTKRKQTQKKKNTMKNEPSSLIIQKFGAVMKNCRPTDWKAQKWGNSWRPLPPPHGPGAAESRAASDEQPVQTANKLSPSTAKPGADVISAELCQSFTQNEH